MPVPADWQQRLKAYIDAWKQNPNDWEYVGDGPFPKFILTEKASSWDDFLSWVSELEGSWCFRGQREAGWLLHTSLDLAVKVDTSTGYRHLDREAEGRDLLFRFQQQAHQYISHPPSTDDLGSWFVLMQHYGAPTRLLDWSRSPYVGLYFAVEEEPRGTNNDSQQGEKCSAVWAIDLAWLEAQSRSELEKSDLRLGISDPESFPDDPKARAAYVNRRLGPGAVRTIIKVDPQETSERMAAQQGVSLCKMIHKASFNQMVMAMMYDDVPEQPVVRKLELPKSIRIELLRRLREMNIHRASLFPGLDGFGRSLKMDLQIKAAEATE